MAALALFRNRGRGFRDASLAAIAGVAFAFGLPGVDLAPLFLLSLVALAFLAVRATSWASTLGIGVAFGASAFLVTTVGSAGWGTIVPIGLTFIGMALYSLPFVTLARWISAQLDQRYAFLCALAGWTLCAELRSQIEFPIHFEAFALVAAGVCDAETVDTVVKEGFGARTAVLGPMEQSDLVGLDLALDIAEVLYEHLDRTAHAPDILREKLKAGKLGIGFGHRHVADDDRNDDADQPAPQGAEHILGLRLRIG